MVAALLLIAPVSVRAATIHIVMQNLESTPAVAAAKVGDTVEWTNKDFVAHTATARNGEFDVNLPPNKTGRIVLKKAGAVDYYCRYHPNMTATLKVKP
jgi:plastocyanin